MQQRQDNPANAAGAEVNEPYVFRAHSVSPKALRGMPSGLLRAAGQRIAANPRANNLVRAVCKGRRDPFAVRQVPVSQAVEVMPEINSGENNPVADSEGLAPEMFMGREVSRCRKCHLNQFMTQSGMCRKCRHSLAPEPIPDVQPVMPSGECRKEIPVFGNLYDRVDMAFAVKLMRDMNGLSQKQLASKMGAPRSYISKLENRKCVPVVESIERLAIFLNVTPYILVTIAEAGCAA